MYNLQAIISKGTNNALIQFERFGEIANNLSNIQDCMVSIATKPYFCVYWWHFSINTETTSSYVKPLYLNTYEPIDEFKGTILKDLALYGYTTYLHPHEILEEHERKYFNYLKLNNAELILTDFNSEIKLHIEEMFNNGVWLWNTNENFANFEVPNYPKLMD